MITSKLASAVTVLIVCAAASAWAQVTVFDNFSPPGSNNYSTATGNIVTSTFFEGVSFTGDGLNLSEVDLALAKTPQPGFTSLTVEVVGSSSGAPNISNVLESWSVTGLPFTPPGQYVPLTSVLDPLLASGTQYWVVVKSPDSGVGIWLPPTATATGGFSFTGDGGANWFQETTGATPVLRVEAVPEPSTLGLLGGSSLLGAYLYLRRRRRTPVKTNIIRTLLFTLILAFASLGNALNARAAENELEDSYVFTLISACPSCSTLPSGINDKGLVSGSYFGAHGHLHGFLVRDGNFLRFDVPGALFTEAGRSNDLGQTAGDYLAADGIDRPFVREPDGSFSLRNGVPGASVTIGADINDRGDVLGWFTRDPNGQTGFKGYVLRGDDFILKFSYPGADVTNTYAIGFNEIGTIVGSFTTSTPGVEHGFVRRPDGKFRQLDFPGSVQTEAFEINDVGDIVGRYQDAQGTQHGFLLHEGHFTSIDAPPGPNTYVVGINAKGTIVGFTVSASGQQIVGFRAHEREDE